MISTVHDMAKFPKKRRFWRASPRKFYIQDCISGVFLKQIRKRIGSKLTKIVIISQNNDFITQILPENVKNKSFTVGVDGFTFPTPPPVASSLVEPYTIYFMHHAQTLPHCQHCPVSRWRSRFLFTALKPPLGSLFLYISKTC